MVVRSSPHDRFGIARGRGRSGALLDTIVLHFTSRGYGAIALFFLCRTGLKRIYLLGRALIRTS